MKKCFLNAVKVLAAVACAVMLGSCATLPSGAKGFDYSERGVNRNPENSVVFYMLFAGNSQMTFAQANPQFGEDIQTLTGSVLISAPCEPGSYYHCTHVEGSKVTQVGANFKTVSTWKDDLEDDYHGFDIKLPSKPGLYYLGFFDGPNSYKSGTFSEMGDDPVFWWPEGDLKRKKLLLNYVKKAYDGTPWAVLATEEQENINATLKNK